MGAAKTLLIVYHSLTGGTRQMAEAARAGAVAEAGCAVRLLHAAQAGPADVLAADGYVFATPENLAAMSGQLKDFFDPRWPGQIPPPLATPNSPRQDRRIMTTRVRRRCVRRPP